MKTNRINEAHKAFVRTLPCCVCGFAIRWSECAHVRLSTFGDVAVPLDERGGTGIKPADSWIVPLCREHHAKQHRMGERPFWEAQGINPLSLAQDLHRNTGQKVPCLGIIQRRREGATEL